MRIKLRFGVGMRLPLTPVICVNEWFAPSRRKTRL
jgi:hypothetical protein